MATTARPLKINLLAQDEFTTSFVGRFLLWALSFGRYIVVFTELIVILSFLSRFSLDRKLTDVNSEIVHQKAIIMAYGDLEERFRFAKQQLEIVSKVNNSLNSVDVFMMLSSMTPTDVRLERLAMSDDTLTITGTSLTSGGFIRLLVGLMNHPLVGVVTVQSVQSQNNDLVLEFQMNATLKDGFLKPLEI